MSTYLLFGRLCISVEMKWLHIKYGANGVIKYSTGFIFSKIRLFIMKYTNYKPGELDEYVQMSNKDNYTY